MSIKCQYCQGYCVKNGFQLSGTQKYRCKICKKYQQENYLYAGCDISKRKLIVPMLTNNMGFSGITEVLGISYSTASKQLFAEAKKCKPPKLKPGGTFEVDEILAYHKDHQPQIWAAYAIEKSTKQVVGINVGRNCKSMLRKTIDAILMTCPKRIYSDGNPSYKRLIPEVVHKTSKKFLQQIERLHLTVRNKLKMLNRKTLAFVRKEETLLACLKLLFWKQVPAPDRSGSL